jgi:hypothetical protein
MMILRTALTDLPATAALAMFLGMIAVWSAIFCGA